MTIDTSSTDAFHSLTNPASAELPSSTASTASPALPAAAPLPIPLVSRVADEAGAAAIERAAYYNHGCFVIVIAPNGAYQMRSTTLDTNVLVGVLTRAIAVITQPTPGAAPGVIERG